MLFPREVAIVSSRGCNCSFTWLQLLLRVIAKNSVPLLFSAQVLQIRAFSPLPYRYLCGGRRKKVAF